MFHRRSVPLYVGAGGIATAAHYLVQVALVELGLATPLAATMVGFTVGATVKYLLNYRFTFRSAELHREVVGRYVVALGIEFLLNAVLFAALHSLGMHYMLAQALTTILGIPPGYVMHRFWVFAPR